MRIDQNYNAPDDIANLARAVSLDTMSLASYDDDDDDDDNEDEDKNSGVCVCLPCVTSEYMYCPPFLLSQIMIQPVVCFLVRLFLPRWKIQLRVETKTPHTLCSLQSTSNWISGRSVL